VKKWANNILNYYNGGWYEFKWTGNIDEYAEAWFWNIYSKRDVVERGTKQL